MIMKVLFKPTFIKEFNNLSKIIKEEVGKICLDIFPKLQNLREFKNYDLKSIKGFKNYYRIRIGDYRIGFKIESNAVIFIRVCHRKDIYKCFP